MITFQDTYDSRKKEIENFLELMKFLEKKENEREDGKSKFSEFFYPETGGIHLTYQSLINILKSNVSLMIYNIIEYTVTMAIYHYVSWRTSVKSISASCISWIIKHLLIVPSATSLTRYLLIPLKKYFKT